jgi:hypothetical protein
MTRCIIIALLVLAAWPGYARSPAEDACRPPPVQLDPLPIVAVEGPAHKGTDRRIEPFALLQMDAAAAWRGRRDEDAAGRGVEAMLRWARAGALSEIVDAGPAQSNTNSIYSLRRALIALLGAWTDLRHAPAGRAHAEEVERWLARLVALQDVATGGKKSRAKGEAMSNHNNHALLRATVAAQWASLPAGANTPMPRRRPSGRALPGWTPMAVCHWRWSADRGRCGTSAMRSPRWSTSPSCLRPSGRDLWRTRPDGADLHRAIAFLLDAIDDPGGSRPSPGPTPTGRTWGSSCRAATAATTWPGPNCIVPASPDAPSPCAFSPCCPSAVNRGWPLIDDYVGGNATCRVLTTAPEAAPPGVAVR